MIRIRTLDKYEVVHVVGSGKSAQNFYGVDFDSTHLIIGVNDAAYDVAQFVRGKKVAVIHFAVDYSYAKTRPVAPGALGLWRRTKPEHPLPKFTEFPAYVSPSEWPWSHGFDLAVSSAWCGGYAAWNLADQVAIDHVHLWGFDGGGRHEKFRPCLEKAARLARVEFTDHAGRL